MRLKSEDFAQILNRPGYAITGQAVAPRIKSPVVECPAGDGALGPRQGKGNDPERILVRVTSFRRRLLDEDNLAEKFHVDCCRYAGLIPSDTPECARIEVRQEKVGKGECEETVVEIFQEVKP